MKRIKEKDIKVIYEEFVPKTPQEIQEAKRAKQWLNTFYDKMFDAILEKHRTGSEKKFDDFHEWLGRRSNKK